MVVVVLVFGLVKLVSAIGGDGTPSAKGTPTTPAGPSTPPVPKCAFGDKGAARAGYQDWRSTLVDTTFRLPAEYQPPDLVSAEGAGFAGPFLVRGVMINDLGALRNAAEAAGNPVEIEAAFRTFDQQQALFAQREAELGHDAALKKVARPGHSEHQLGTTIDLKTAGQPDVDLAWASTPAGGWTMAHAAEFGFVLSYPEGGQPKTCYQYEPWHYRYFGRERAAKIVASGLTIREFLWRQAHA